MPTPRLTLLLALSLALASTALAQVPKEQILFQSNLTAAQKQAKAVGLPVMVVVRGKGTRLPEALANRNVIKRSTSFVNVVVAAESPVAKKLEGAKPGVVLFLDDQGGSLATVDADATAEQLLREMDSVTSKTREALLEKLLSGKDVTTGKEAAGQKAAFDSYVRLGATTSDLLPLLAHRNTRIKTALGTALAARIPEGADWALLNAMGSPDPDVRAGSHSVAVAVTKVPKVPPASFWKDASEEDRAAALEKWREAVYGKLPPVNRAILDYCFKNYGKQVDNGECAMLAVEAGKAAHAKPIQHKDKTYIWGEVISGDNVLAGDIIQMEDAKFSDGVSASHHTQIIRRVLGNGQYQVLEQNANGRRTVGLGKLNVKLRTQGTVVIYRPQPLDAKK